MIGINEFREKYMHGCFDGNLIEEKYGDYFRENAQVGEGATVHLWSDAHAYTIIRRTEKSLTLRRCKATLKKEFKPIFIPGGFAGTVINQYEQDYTYEEDENGEIVQAHWSQKKHGFYVKRCMYVTPGRREFYDYNF